MHEILPGVQLQLLELDARWQHNMLRLLELLLEGLVLDVQRMCTFDNRIYQWYGP